MLKVSNLYKREEGAGLLLFIFVLFVMLGVGGLVVDMGIVYKTRGEMRKAANAAALSGAQEIPSKSNTIIENVVKDILVAHNPEYTSNINNWSWELEEDKTIKVVLEQTVHTFFMRIFGVSSIPLEVMSRAKISPMAAVTGAMPLGVSKDSITLKSDMEWEKFLLKANPSETNYGKYGIISFENKDPGAKDYKEYLENGYSGKIEYGDILYTKSGSVAADDKIMEAKINNSIYSTLQSVKDAYNNNTLDYNDSRIMLVIVYDEGDIIDANQNIREITVVGFAYYYLDSYIKDGNDREINGYIIPRVFTSLANENALDLASYTIRLVE
jgi:hypothetical protein